MPGPPRQHPATKVTVEVDGRRMKLSSLEKVMYPATGTTKAEVIDYYARISAVILPHLAHRPVTRIRYPHGVGDMQFFEKNVPAGTPDWIRRAGRDPVFPFIDDLAGLTFFANLNSLELHVPQWRFDGVGREAVALNPDRLVIDLDPGPGTGLREVSVVAVLVRERLTEIGLDPVPVTSGSKGMQLYASLPGAAHTSDEIRDTVQQLAQELARKHPDLVVWKMAKDLRPGKIFLDWSQNVAAKTTICPYSLRGREAPTVAAPRSWDEVEAGADGEELRQLRSDEVLERVEDFGDLAAQIAGPRGCRRERQCRRRVSGPCRRPPGSPRRSGPGRTPGTRWTEPTRELRRGRTVWPLHRRTSGVVRARRCCDVRARSRMPVRRAAFAHSSR